MSRPEARLWLPERARRLIPRALFLGPERTGRVEDLDEAIRRVRQAVDTVPKYHPNLTDWLNNLGTSLKGAFRDRKDGRLGRVDSSSTADSEYHASRSP